MKDAESSQDPAGPDDPGAVSRSETIEFRPAPEPADEEPTLPEDEQPEPAEEPQAAAPPDEVDTVEVPQPESEDTPEPEPEPEPEPAQADEAPEPAPEPQAEQQSQATKITRETPKPDPRASAPQQGLPHADPRASAPPQGLPQADPRASAPPQGLPQTDPRASAPPQGWPQADPRASAPPQGLPQTDPRASAPPQGLPQTDPRASAPSQGLPQADPRASAPPQGWPQTDPRASAPPQGWPQADPRASASPHGLPQADPRASAPPQGLPQAGVTREQRLPGGRQRPSQVRQALQGGVPQETSLDLPSQNQQVPQEEWQQGGWGQDAQSPWPEREEHGSWGQEQPSPASSGAWTVEPVQEVPAKKGRRTGLIALVAALVLVGGVVAGQLVRPVPEPSVELVVKSSHTFQGSAPRLPWPMQGQSAVYVEGLGSMGASGAKAPTPTASVAKVMTAYVFLRDHPLAAGQAGPTYTVSQQSAVEMPGRKRRGESILGIVPNQRLTERKALEALMVISANDVAVELARWDSGNVPAFVRKMNEAARALGMTSTRYTDPSGYDRGTVSTAADQVKLLRAAMAVPAFAETVNKAAYQPDNGAPATRGGNTLLGQLGVIGGKTGYTDAAGGNFVFAAKKRVGGVETMILGAVMGQRSPNAQGAVEAARTLVAGAGRSLVSTVLAPAGSTVAEVDDGLGGKTPLTASTPVTVVGWPGLTVPVSVTGEPPRVAASGERIGNVKTGAGSVPLVAGAQLSEPSLVKRLTRVS